MDINGATDISSIGTTNANGLPTTGAGGVTPVSKAAYLDLLDPAFGLVGSTFPEKVEGLAFGPDLADGRHLLLVTSDNDFFATQPSRFFAFALDNLPEYQAQQVVPEPGTILLLITGLIGMLAIRRWHFMRTN